MTAPDVINRRELKTRRAAWPSAVARALASAGMTPNMVSVLSVVFAVIAGLSFAAVGFSWGEHPSAWLVVAAAGIQLRLLCNMLDGLLAIEGGLKAKTGDMYNEIPDRLGDIAILLGAGIAVRALPFGIHLGWATALVAVLTAYVRLLGGSFGLKQDFSGPMAKQHRMFTVTVGALVGAAEAAMNGSLWSLYVALWIVLLGSKLTLVRRTARIASALESR